MRTSVLINNRNNGPYLDHCLSSVFSQRPAPDEVILYDDGSNDESLAIAAKYKGRLKIIAAPRGPGTPIQNQAHAIDAAFRASTGDVIFLLDGDDGFLAGKIAAYLAVFAADPFVVLVQSPLIKIDRSGYVIGVEFEAPRHQPDYAAHINATHEINIYYPTSALAFRRTYLERRLPLSPERNEMAWPDAQLALIAPLFGRVVALPRPFSEWRRHPRSQTVMKSHSIYRLVRFNQDYFNTYCQNVGRPGLETWKSQHHIKRWFRHYFIPELCMGLYRKARWAIMSDRQRRAMLNGVDFNALGRLVNARR